MISTNLGLAINQLLWFHLFWLKNLVWISLLKTLFYTPEICERKIPLFLAADWKAVHKFFANPGD